MPCLPASTSTFNCFLQARFCASFICAPPRNNLPISSFNHDQRRHPWLWIDCFICKPVKWHQFVSPPLWNFPPLASNTYTLRRVRPPSSFSPSALSCSLLSCSVVCFRVEVRRQRRPQRDCCVCLGPRLCVRVCVCEMVQMAQPSASGASDHEFALTCLTSSALNLPRASVSLRTQTVTRIKNAAANRIRWSMEEIIVWWFFFVCVFESSAPSFSFSF